MISATPRLSRVSTAIAVLFALAAAPAVAGPAFLKFGGVDGDTKDRHKNEIEILSWSWGATQAKGKIEHEWKVEEGESAPPAPGGTAKFGAVSGMHRNSDMAVKGSKIGQNSAAGDPDRPLVAGRIPNANAAGDTTAGDVDGDGRAEVARKRQHGWVTVSKPLARGAVRGRPRRRGTAAASAPATRRWILATAPGSTSCAA